MQIGTVERARRRTPLADKLVSLPATAPTIFRAMLWIVFGGAAAELILRAIKSEAADWFEAAFWGDEFVPTATKSQ